MLGHCPECWRAGRDSLHEITPTPEPLESDLDGTPRGSARRWQIVVHSDKAGKLCPGSGAKI